MTDGRRRRVDGRSLALLRPDARRWLALGALLGIGSALALTGPVIIRSVVDRATEGADTAEIVRLALAFLAVAVVTQLVARGRRPPGHDQRLADHERPAAADHAPRARPRPRVPPHPHARRADPAGRRRRHVGLGLPRPGRAEGDERGAARARHARCAHRRSTGGSALGMAVYLVAATAVVLAMRHRAVAESADEMGALRPALRRHRGAPDRGRGPAGRTAPASHAMWRFVEESSGALDASVKRERAFLRCGGVSRAPSPSARRGRWCSARCWWPRTPRRLGTAFLLFQYVRLMARPLEDARAPAGDGAEGERRDAPRRGPARRAADDPRHRDDVPAGRPAGRRACGGVTFDYGDDQSILHDVDLDIAAGRSVGVVGRTGSRQDDVLPAAAAPGRRHRRRRHARRRADHRHPARRAAPTRGARAPGGRAVRGHGSATTSPCSTRRRSTRPSVERPPPGRARTAGGRRHPPPARRRRHRPVGGRGPAAGARPGLAARPRPRRARRGHGPRRPGDRALASSTPSPS